MLSSLSTSFSSPLSTPAGRRQTVRTTSSIARQATRAEQVLEENNQFLVTAKNSPVPVQVQEVLRDNSHDVSVKLDQSGWAWIVSGDKAYFWRYISSHTTSTCIRLALPHSWSGPAQKWNASLLTVQVMPRSCDLVCVAGATPDGRVFFWKGGSEEAPYKECRIQLAIDVTLLSICNLEVSGGVGMLSSTGAIHLLNPTSSQPPVKLEASQGMLSGIGRRFSSLLFGSQAGASSNKEGVCAVAMTTREGAELMYVLTKSNLQAWRILSLETDQQQMMFNVDILMMIKDSLMTQDWFPSSEYHVDDIRVWLLDCQMSLMGLVVLFASSLCNIDSRTLKYGLVLIPIDSVPYCCDQLIDIHYTECCNPETEEIIPSQLKIQACHAHSQVGVYCPRFIIPVQLNRLVNGGEPRPDLSACKIDMESHNAVLGSGNCQNEVLFFTLKHGIISLKVFSLSDVTPQKRAKTQSSQSARRVASIVTSRVAPRAPLSIDHLRDAYEMETEELKNAFMLYLSNNLSESSVLCSRVFPNQSFTSGINTPGDVAVMRLSEMVLNDVPSADPRWEAAPPLTRTPGLSESFSSSTSLIIVYQLQDKLEAHTRLVQFLSDVQLLDKLTCLSVRGKAMSTCNLLCEHAEKISAAIALKKSINGVVVDSIKAVLQERQPLGHLRPGLTAQDLFFSQVSSLDDIFKCLIHSQSNSLRTLENPIDRINVGIGVAKAIQNMLSEAVEYRESHHTLYTGSTHRAIAMEYVPWTACEGDCGGRTLLTEELNCLIELWEECSSEPISGQDRQLLWSLYCGLSRQLFIGYEDQIQSMKGHPEFKDDLRSAQVDFDDDRNRYIGFAFDQSQLVVATELAETFHHFQTLIRTCELHNNKGQLKNYFDQFKESGFDNSLFSYYLNSGNTQMLLSYSNLFPKELELFLSAHPQLLWIHYLASNEYNKASKCLVDLAGDEGDSLARQKTMLSIAKLTAIAENKETDSTKEINRQLKQIEFQENISESILMKEGLCVDSMPPLPPNRVIELYVESDSANVDSFLCALEYATSVYENNVDPELVELLVYIWSHAILKDDWDDLQTDEPLTVLRDTFFMSLASKGISDGIPVPSLLPDIDDIIHSDVLAHLRHSNTFSFLLRAAYENIGQQQ